MENKTLKDKILEEMTVDYKNTLEKKFQLAKQFIRVTKDGKVDIIIKDKLKGKEQILLYLIGKLYAKEAGLSSTEYATNKEIMEQLGIPEGSVKPWLKELRDKNRIKAIKEGNHAISINFIEKILEEIKNKIKS